MRSDTHWHGMAAEALPRDADSAVLLGRAWDSGHAGPVPITVCEGAVYAIDEADTVRDLTEHEDPAAAVRESRGRLLGDLDELLANTPRETRDPSRPWLLSPMDLHVIKAAGVTFAASLVERIIEERALGEPESAAAVRAEIEAILGDGLAQLVPGSAEAAEVRVALTRRGLWSQYLEVGIGPHAELFTKAPVLASVGTATDIGVRDDSAWNNPEPEVVLIVSSGGRAVGAALGNDVNHRDLEGRSALLLGQAKDNTASAAIGPFIRLFDEAFTLDDVRAMRVHLTVEGTDGFTLVDSSAMSLISRDPADLIAQAVGRRHQYPDGFCLYLGTMFAPTLDREATGRGFTHHTDDVVRISTDRLGTLVNRVRPTPDVEPWSFGIADLLASVGRRRRVMEASR